MALARSHPVKLSGDVNRILFVKNLNYKTKGEDLYDLFGKYGAIRQIRIGTDPKTRGTAFVVYEDILDAKNAFDHLNGFHLQERYLVGQSPIHPKQFRRFSRIMSPKDTPFEAAHHPFFFFFAFIVLYHQFQRQAAKADLAKREAELIALKKTHNISDDTE
ncbi:hypothetical protein PGTUg99_026174 [Puccinia graminis f. sp. tritici]|uniref:RRM domain-containing protein n=1 Tax=Puccinia graminis f. sp. tritici TaxID=56615 RepID=A0A5B0Q7U6_PUCGR|nr:hypothetical protein PGTUg99_026174 [Puccinia graminis f. sp. tritici]